MYVLVDLVDVQHPDVDDGDTVTFDVFVDIGGGSVINKTVELVYETTNPTYNSVS